jgi:hypothetical protein
MKPTAPKAMKIEIGDANDTSFVKLQKLADSARLKQTIAANEHPRSITVTRPAERNRQMEIRKANHLSA